MRTHATSQLTGGRSHQCDATATYTHDGARAFALLDGIGSSKAVQEWTRAAARRLARAAARQGAEGGLRAIHAVAAAERARSARRFYDAPAAVAVVAVATPRGLSDEAPIGAVTRGAERCRLLLASDGAYEPLEDAGRDLTSYLAGTPTLAARTLVRAAIAHAPGRADNATVLVADLGLPD